MSLSSTKNVNIGKNKQPSQLKCSWCQKKYKSLDFSQIYGPCKKEFCTEKCLSDFNSGINERGQCEYCYGVLPLDFRCRQFSPPTGVTASYSNGKEDVGEQHVFCSPHCLNRYKVEMMISHDKDDVEEGCDELQPSDNHPDIARGANSSSDLCDSKPTSGNRKGDESPGLSNGVFSWESYLSETGAEAAPPDYFKHSIPAAPSNIFEIDDKLEAADPRNVYSTCIATVVGLCGPRILLRLDGTDNQNDFWRLVDSADIHPIGYTEEHKNLLQPPLGFRGNTSSWPSFLTKTLSTAKLPDKSAFKPLPKGPKSNLFDVGHKLEAVDRKNPQLICPATVGKIQGDKLQVVLDGWKGASSYWCRYDSRDIFPVGWCKAANYQLQPPGYKTFTPHAQLAILKAAKKESNDKPSCKKSNTGGKDKRRGSKCASVDGDGTNKISNLLRRSKSYESSVDGDENGSKRLDIDSLSSDASSSTETNGKADLVTSSSPSHKQSGVLKVEEPSTSAPVSRSKSTPLTLPLTSNHTLTPKSVPLISSTAIPLPPPPTSNSTIPLPPPPTSNSTIPLPPPPTSHSTIPLPHPPTSHSTIALPTPPTSHSTISVKPLLTSQSTIPLPHPPTSHSTIPLQYPPTSHSTIPFPNPPPLPHPPTSHSTIPSPHPPTSHSPIALKTPPTSHSTIPLPHKPTSYATIPLPTPPISHSTLTSQPLLTPQSTIQFPPSPSSRPAIPLSLPPSSLPTMTLPLPSSSHPTATLPSSTTSLATNLLPPTTTSASHPATPNKCSMLADSSSKVVASHSKLVTAYMYLSCRCGPYLNMYLLHEMGNTNSRRMQDMLVMGPAAPQYVLRDLAQMCIDCSHNPEDILHLIQPGNSNTFITANIEGQIQNVTLPRVTSAIDMWKVVEQLREDLMCCENFFSRLPLVSSQPCVKCHGAVRQLQPPPPPPRISPTPNAATYNIKNQADRSAGMSTVSPYQYTPHHTPPHTTPEGSTSHVVGPSPTPFSTSMSGYGARTPPPVGNGSNLITSSSREDTDSPAMKRIRRASANVDSDSEASTTDVRNKNPYEWNVEDVVKFVSDHVPGMHSYAKNFKDQEIDGQALMLLNDDLLMKHLRFKLGPAVKMSSALDELRSKWKMPDV